MSIRGYFTSQHILSVTFAVICVVYLLSFDIHYNEDFLVWNIINVIGTVIALLTALTVTLRKDADLQFSLGLIAFGLGVMILSKLIGGLVSGNILVILVSAVCCVIGLMCILLSFPIYCGSRYDTTRISLVLLIYCALILVIILWGTAFGGKTLFEKLDEYKLELMTIIPALLYILSINSSTLHYKSFSNRLKNNMNSISKSMLSDRNAFIERTYLKDYEDTWIENRVGYMVAEQSIPIHMDHGMSTLVLQKWTDGSVWGMLVHDSSGTIIQALRFKICSIVTDGDVKNCHLLTIYGEEGFYMQLLVKDIDHKKTDGFLRKALHFLTGC